MLKRLLFLMAIVLSISTIAISQVTTSGITGTIKNPENSGLAGATVKATHTPSGTVYTTVVSSSGVFNLPGMRPGGPYVIEISFVGFPTRKLENVYLTLGEPYVVNETLSTTGTELTNVVVSATSRGSRLDRNKTGAATNITAQQLSSLPTLNRSITDFTRLTPQANGNSFAGRDGRYNNLQVDGANFNNGFGLNDNPLPGGGGLSLDAIEEIQVNIAPFDVRQSGFSGAGINAITRSGTNRVTGSAYYYFRNQDLSGNRVKDLKVPKNETSSKTMGIRVGGPIIKNKLFFFINAEKIENKGNNAGAVNLWKASDNGVANPDQNIARPTRTDLEAVRNHLINQWGYDPGRYEGYALNNGDETTSILARIDWNINANHKLAVRYNQVKSSTPSLVNGNSGPYPRSTSANRVSAQSMAFESTMYFTDNIVRSATLELNSRLGRRWSNQLLGTFSRIQATRSSNSSIFPMIDIGDGLGTSSTYVNYITAGYELFTYGNDVLNDNFSIVNNATMTAGKHTMTVGASFEMQKFGNQYLRLGTSYYRYASVADFLTTGTPGEVAPLQYGLTYAYPGEDSYAPIKYGLPSVYIQDVISVTDRFTLTAGVRAEVPWFINKLTANTAVESLELLDQNGNGKYYSTSSWPKTRVMLSPRVGFRWDVEGNRSFILRGGTGIFAGRVPFVWLTNMPSNSGVIQNTIEPGSYAASAGWINDIRFNPDPYYWLNNTPASAQNVFIKSPNAGVPSSLALVDENFKMPQIWRTSFGFDKKLGNTGLVVSADMMYTKDLQAVYQFGANRRAAAQKMNIGGNDRRDFYPTAASYTYNSALGGNAGSVLSNTTKGHSFNTTVGISLPSRKGLFGSVFYSYTLSNTTTDNSGSNASSAWGATPTINNPNDLILASATDALPHRIVGNVSYRFEYFKAAATTISLYYNGANQGRYSFTYNGDVNGDAIAGDLLYIPNNANELLWAPITGTTAFSVDEQKAAFDKLLANNKYLDKNRGRYAERNGVLLPWYNRIDFKILQDLFVNIGKQKNTLQLSVDVVNLPNLINRDWGIQKTLISGVNAPLARASVTSDGVPTFRMRTVDIGGQTVLPTSVLRNVTSLGTTWSMQIGIRYLFN